VNPSAAVEAILDAWRLPRPRVTAKAEGGYQNTTLFVSCAGGEFVLRVYSNVVDPARQRFEHELLQKLASAELSFAVPRPLPSDDGDTLRVIDGRLAVLFTRIPGETLAKDGGPYLARAAAALAELDVALAALREFAHRPPIFEGDLTRVHPLADDLDEAVAESGLERDRRNALRGGLERSAELAPLVYTSLPQQVTHGDFAFGNTLVRNGRVTGLLDFEHSGLDVRAMDLTAGSIDSPRTTTRLRSATTLGEPTRRCSRLIRPRSSRFPRCSSSARASASCTGSGGCGRASPRSTRFVHEPIARSSPTSGCARTATSSCAAPSVGSASASRSI